MRNFNRVTTDANMLVIYSISDEYNNFNELPFIELKAKEQLAKAFESKKAYVFEAYSFALECLSLRKGKLAAENYFERDLCLTSSEAAVVFNLASFFVFIRIKISARGQYGSDSKCFSYHNLNTGKSLVVQYFVR